MTRARAKALIVLAEPRLINPQRQRIVELAAKSRLPAIYNWRTDTDAGGLMSLWTQRARARPVPRYLCEQDFQERQARRSANRAADEVRAGHQSEDGQSTGTHNPPIA